MGFFTSILTRDIGRKTLLIFGAAVNYIALITIAVCSFFFERESENNKDLLFSYLIIFMIYLYCFGYGVSFGPIIWLYNAEILPEKGVSIATLCNWTAIIFISFMFPICK